MKITPYLVASLPAQQNLSVNFLAEKLRTFVTKNRIPLIVILLIYSFISGLAQTPPACRNIENEIEVLESKFTKTVRVRDSNGGWTLVERVFNPPNASVIKSQIASKKRQLEQCKNDNSCFAQQILEGGIYKECSSKEIFFIHNNVRIFIPTEDALLVMGYNLNMVKKVPDGALNNITRFDISSASPTPGSIVFPPIGGAGHHAIKGLNNSTEVVSQGKEVVLGELKGWLRHVDKGCNTAEGSGADFFYALELDLEWAKANGLDIHKLLKVGNISKLGILDVINAPTTSMRKTVSTPLIGIELNSWGWRDRFPPNNRKPVDWNKTIACKNLFWPFDPFIYNSDSLKEGQYISIHGSIVSDHPHDEQGFIALYLSRYLSIQVDVPEKTITLPTGGTVTFRSDAKEAEWLGCVPDWSPNVSTQSPYHYARWTEMHPPDLIKILADKDKKTSSLTVRALALSARAAATPGPIVPSCEEIEFDIYPPEPKPLHSIIAYEESKGPECHFPWGENSDNGTWVTNLGDHIHVRAKVCGGALGGSPGRIKAIYMVRWIDKPIKDGDLLRELSSNEMYIIQNGKKRLVPDLIALKNIGYDIGQLQMVPDGTLSNYPPATPFTRCESIKAKIAENEITILEIERDPNLGRAAKTRAKRTLQRENDSLKAQLQQNRCPV